LDVVQILLSVVLVCAAVLCGVAVWALRDIVATSRSLRSTSDELRERIVPLAEKADVTVDALNAELLRVDGIITQFEDTSSRVSHASATISDIVNAPGEIVSEAASRVRRAWIDRRPAPAPPPAPPVEADNSDQNVEGIS
jgi:hypothetical protein